jgi:hypothetical protein
MADAAVVATGHAECVEEPCACDVGCGGAVGGDVAAVAESEQLPRAEDDHSTVAHQVADPETVAPVRDGTCYRELGAERVRNLVADVVIGDDWSADLRRDEGAVTDPNPGVARRFLRARRGSSRKGLSARRE